MFVHRYEDKQVKSQVVLNQKTRMRQYTFPSVQTAKTFTGFIDELVDYVNSLKPSDFTQCREYELHYAAVTEGNVKSHSVNDPLADFISPKILEKLNEDKYSGDYKTQILLLHNYSIIGDTEISSDINFYAHHRNDILNLLWQYINENKSLDFYDNIYFLDFSAYVFNANFDLVDFKNYSARESSKFLHGYNEIRIDIGNVQFK